MKAITKKAKFTTDSLLLHTHFNIKKPHCTQTCLKIAKLKSSFIWSPETYVFLENLLHTIISQPPNPATLLLFNFESIFPMINFTYSSIDLLHCTCQNILTARLEI